VSPADRRTNPATILLVEDHEDTREMYLAVLEGAGYSVLAVASQLAAIPKPPKLIAASGACSKHDLLLRPDWSTTTIA
jgi:CheY-like chemotaxis protein